ncbi:hypothetical protein IH979_01600 [Patescibacteria group bacterium]|nr:hypothetical protein [Patescibacteria group bacterium]
MEHSVIEEQSLIERVQEIHDVFNDDKHVLTDGTRLWQATLKIQGDLERDPGKVEEIERTIGIDPKQLSDIIKDDFHADFSSQLRAFENLTPEEQVSKRNDVSSQFMEMIETATDLNVDETEFVNRMVAANLL